MTIRLAIGAAIYGIGMALTVFAKVPLPVELVFLIVSYIILGGDVVWQAVRNISKGRVFDEHFLMSVSTIGAFVIGEYPEAVAVMLFYQVGEFFQSLAVERSRKSISDLMDIRPDCATVRRNGELITISPESVAIGEIIIVKPGEKIPLDGVVLDGDSMLDTRALTGESVPRSVHKGDEALSGCMNQTGVLTIKTTKAFGESTASKIIDLVENASSRKAPTENFITTFCTLLHSCCCNLSSYSGNSATDPSWWRLDRVDSQRICFPCGILPMCIGHFNPADFLRRYWCGI